MIREQDTTIGFHVWGSEKLSEEQVKEIFDLAAEVYSLDKCILQSFEFDNLIKAHEQFPDLRIMLTYGMGDEGYERCFDYGFSIDCDYQVITEEMIDEFHSRGLEVAVWTANDSNSLRSSSLSAGFSPVISDSTSP